MCEFRFFWEKDLEILLDKNMGPGRIFGTRKIWQKLGIMVTYQPFREGELSSTFEVNRGGRQTLYIMYRSGIIVKNTERFTGDLEADLLERIA